MRSSFVLSVGLLVAILGSASSAQAGGKKRSSASKSPVQTLEVVQSGNFSGVVKLVPAEKNQNTPTLALRSTQFSSTPISDSLNLGGALYKGIEIELSHDTVSNVRAGTRRTAVLKASVEFQGKDKDAGFKVVVKNSEVSFEGKKQGQINCKNSIPVTNRNGAVQVDLTKFKSFLTCEIKDAERYDPSAVNRTRFITPVSTRGGISFLTIPLYGERDDYQLGSDFQAEYNSKHAYSILPSWHPTSQYVRRLGADLIRAAGKDMKSFHPEFYVVNSDVINAFAVPGGPIYVFRGLIEAAESEAALSGVMGHELAHVTARHYSRGVTIFMSDVVQKMIAAFGVGILANQVVKDGDFSKVLTGALQVYAIGSAYVERFHKSRQFELESDQYGSQYNYNLDIAPWGLAEMFEVFTKKFGDRKGSWLEESLRSHPHHAERISLVNNLSAFYYPPKQNYRSLNPIEFQDAQRELSYYRKPTQLENEQVLSFIETHYKTLTETKLKTELSKIIKIQE